MRIAFASCSNIIMQRGHQPIWQEILKQGPDLLLLLGDNVYMGPGAFDAAMLECHYRKQLAEPHFAELLKKVPYLAIWDNHDFGSNERYSDTLTTEQKQQSRKLFNTYLKRSSLAPRTPFVYCSHTMENAKVIMLDVRSYQIDPLMKGATLLGTEQEKWLLEQMQHRGRFTIVCSGMTFSIGKDSWTQYPEWARQFRAAMSVAPNPLFLGGNMHRNGFIQHIEIDLPIGAARKEFPLPITKPNFYELISSSVGRTKGGVPKDKYGIVDFSKNTVEVHLWSRDITNQFHKTISAINWQLE